MNVSNPVQWQALALCFMPISSAFNSALFTQIEYLLHYSLYSLHLFFKRESDAFRPIILDAELLPVPTTLQAKLK